MEAGQALTIRAAPWCDLAAATLAPAVRHVGNLAAQVQSGAAALFWLEGEGATVGAFVLRVDHPPSGAEGVIVAAAGRAPGVDLTALMLPLVEGMFKGCQRLRIHTARPGLGAKLGAMGYGLQEAVYTKDLKDHEAA